MSIDPVILRLEADLRKYQTDLSGAQRLTEQKLSAIEARGVQMGQGLKRGFSLAQTAALGYVAAVSATDLTNAIRSGLDYASSLGETAQQLGVTTAALQEYRYAATQAGLGQEEIDQALSQLTRRLGEAASGTKAQAEAFAKLGVSVKDANGQVIATGEAIPMIAEALKGIQSPAERAAILMDLFGRAGQKLEPLLAGGSDAVNELRQAAHNLGIVLSDSEIQNADRTADKLSELNTVLQARIAGAVSENANAIYGLASALTSLTTGALNYISAYPKLSAALAGAAIGARLGGYPGAAIGAVAGITGGASLEQQQSDQNMDLRFRAQKLRAATANYRRMRESEKTGGGPIFGFRKVSGPEGAGGTVQGAREELSKQMRLLGAAQRGGASPASSAGLPPSQNATPPMSGTSRAGGADRTSQNEARYLDELGRLRVDRLRIEGDYSGSVEAKYAAVIAALDEELASFARQVETDEGLSATKRARLIAEKTATVEAERANAEQDRTRDIAERAAALSEAELRAQQDTLSAKAMLAENSKDRLRFELELFDLQERLRMAELDRVLATEATASTVWQAAKIQKEALEQSRGDRRGGVARQNEGPLAAYTRSLSPERVDDQIEGLVIDELQSVRDSIRSAVEKATGIKDPLISGLVNLLIEQVLIRPIAEALSKSGGLGGGGGGFVSSVIGSLFGRASGGAVNAGQMYRVNEGASPGRVEGFIPQGSGTIIPLGQMNAKVGGGGSPRVFHINVDARNSVTPTGFAQQLSAVILQQAAQMDAQSSVRTLKSVPGRFDQYQRDGN